MEKRAIRRRRRKKRRGALCEFFPWRLWQIPNHPKREPRKNTNKNPIKAQLGESIIIWLGLFTGGWVRSYLQKHGQFKGNRITKNPTPAWVIAHKNYRWHDWSVSSRQLSQQGSSTPVMWQMLFLGNHEQTSTLPRQGANSRCMGFIELAASHQNS